MNVTLLRRVKRRILGSPRRLVMGPYFVRGVAAGCDYDLPRGAGCGTAACIAGWTVTEGHKYASPHVARAVGFDDVWEEATTALGIENSQASGLFIVEGWPPYYQEAWGKAKTLTARARVAAQRIEHFIKTNGAE